MSASAAGAVTPWSDARLAARMIAIDPHGLKGIRVRARASAARDRWLETLSELVSSDMAWSRVSACVPLQRLIGGLDVARSIEQGRPVVERGVLAGAHGGFLVVSMAERLEASSASVIAAAIDQGTIRIERDGVSAAAAAGFALVALDEGVDDEALPAALADRLALSIDLNGISLSDLREEDGAVDDLAAARALLPSVTVPDGLYEALSAAGMATGGASARTPIHLVRVARAAAALRGAQGVSGEDAVTALRLVMGIRPSPADEQSSQPEETAPDQPEPDDADGSDEHTPSGDALRDMLVQAEAANLPPGVLARLEALGAASMRRGAAGKSGAVRKGTRRGRTVGTTDRRPSSASRPDVLATLRQAAPWQRQRAAGAATMAGGDRRLHIRRSDFRYMRFREKTGTTAIFAVDASGSAAAERLAETKGAVELLLAECYVRRDQVALIAFRGTRSEALLEPTRSLVRAKRCLSGLPGGGGTPLANGILNTLSMAQSALAKGQGVVAVFLTDGRGNVALDGGTDKAKVTEDTLRAARRFRASGTRAVLIDTAPRPQERARALARELGAEYLPLPRGGARAVAREIGARMES